METYKLMAYFNTPGLNPKNLGLNKDFSSVDDYKNQVIINIDKYFSEFVVKNSLEQEPEAQFLPDYAEYLKFLVESAGTQKTFSKYREIKGFIEKSKSSNGNSGFNEIEVYFSEVIGPIAIINDNKLKQKLTVDNRSKVSFPPGSSQRGYDFKLGGIPITAKKSSGTTNTLKPSSIIIDGGIAFKKVIYNTNNDKLKFIYELFEHLNDNSPKDGPYTAIYGNKNSILNQLVGKNPQQDSVLIPGNSSTPIPEDIISLYANALEKQIENWSKSTQWNSSFIEFTNLYYNTIGLYNYSYAVEKSSGIGVPQAKNQVIGAMLKGKGRAGPFGSDAQGNKTNNPTSVHPERMGIQIKI
jgi:hypothetical protein